MPSSASRRPPLEAGDFARTVLGPSLHRTYDAVLQEPMPKDLLIAGGLGPAKWDALLREWGTREGEA